MVEIVTRLEASNAAARESPVATPQALAGKQVDALGSAPNLTPASTCQASTPNARPTSAVATYDPVVLANVPPSPFATALDIGDRAPPPLPRVYDETRPSGNGSQEPCPE